MTLLCSKYLVSIKFSKASYLNMCLRNVQFLFLIQSASVFFRPIFFKTSYLHTCSPCYSQHQSFFSGVISFHYLSVLWKLRGSKRSIMYRFVTDGFLCSISEKLYNFQDRFLPKNVDDNWIARWRRCSITEVPLYSEYPSVELHFYILKSLFVWEEIVHY